MFINLVNTDIPFAEYQLTQDQIDALKFRLLWSEGYLYADELQEHYDPFERYMIYLLTIEGKLMFLLVSNGTDINTPLLQMVDMSESEPQQLSEEELIAFLSKSYAQNPDKPLIANLSITEAQMQTIIERLKDELERIVKYHRPIDAPIEEPPLHHYDLYHEPVPMYYDIDELSSAESAEVDRLMKIILKKVYNYEY